MQSALFGDLARPGISGWAVPCPVMTVLLNHVCLSLLEMPNTHLKFMFVILKKVSNTYQLL